MTGPIADVSARAARPSDAAQIARVQHQTWQAAYAAVLPAEALALPEADLEQAWAAALATAPSPAHRVIVAIETGQVVGMAATEPCADGAELTALLVEPAAGRRGHGSRLLSALADHWRQQGVGLAQTWVFESDAVVSAFLASAGWAPETVGRLLEADGTHVRQRRWQTAL